MRRSANGLRFEAAPSAAVDCPCASAAIGMHAEFTPGDDAVLLPTRPEGGAGAGGAAEEDGAVRANGSHRAARSWRPVSVDARRSTALGAPEGDDADATDGDNAAARSLPSGLAREETSRDPSDSNARSRAALLAGAWASRRRVSSDGPSLAATPYGTSPPRFPATSDAVLDRRPMAAIVPRRCGRGGVGGCGGGASGDGDTAPTACGFGLLAGCRTRRAGLPRCSTTATRFSRPLSSCCARSSAMEPATAAASTESVNCDGRRRVSGAVQSARR